MFMLYKIEVLAYLIQLILVVFVFSVQNKLIVLKKYDNYTLLLPVHFIMAVLLLSNIKRILLNYLMQ